MHARAIPAQESDMPRNLTLGLVLSALVVLLVVLHWPRRGPAFEVPPALDAAAIAALPDNQLLVAVATDLRYAVAAHGGPATWRTLPASARHVLALSWVDKDLPPGCPSPSQPGFAAIAGANQPDAPAFTDVAEAYDAIGAPAVAAVVRDAEKIAATQPAGASGGPYGLVDQRFREQTRKEATLAKLRAYIRSNAGELAAAARR